MYTTHKYKLINNIKNTNDKSNCMPTGWSSKNTIWNKSLSCQLNLQAFKTPLKKFKNLNLKIPIKFIIVWRKNSVKFEKSTAKNP